MNLKRSLIWCLLIFLVAFSPSGKLSTNQKAYFEFKAKFKKVRPSKRQLQEVVPKYVYQCTNGGFLDVDTNCGQFIESRLRKVLLSKPNPIGEIYFAHSYCKLSNGIEIFIVEEWYLANPKPSLFLYAFRNGVMVDSVQIYDDPIPPDSSNGHEIRFQVMKLNRTELIFRVSENFIERSDQVVNYQTVEYSLEGDKLKEKQLTGPN